MYFKKAVIKGFGRFFNLEIEFARGINLIFGDNESGKTTLHWFIRGILYGMEGGRVKKDGLLPPSRRYEPWNGNAYGGYLEYVLDSGEFFRVERDFKSGVTTVYDDAFNDITHRFGLDRGKSVMVGEKHLGIDDVGFTRTVFVGQLNTNPGVKGGAGIMEKLSNASLAFDEEVSLNRACEALNDAVREHVGTEKTKTKPLDKVKERIFELELRKGKLLSGRQHVLELESRLKEISDRKKALSDASEMAEVLLRLSESEKRCTRLQHLLDKAEEMENKTKQIAECMSSLEKTLEETASFSEYTVRDAAEIKSDFKLLKSAAQEDMKDLTESLDFIHKRKQRLKEEIKQHNEKPENRKFLFRKVMFPSSMVLVFALAAAMLAIIGAKGLSYAIYGAMAAAATAAAAGIAVYRYFYFKRQLHSEQERYKETAGKISGLDEDEQRFLKRIGEKEKKIGEAAETIAKKLVNAGLVQTGDEPDEETVAAFVQGVERYERTMQELDKKKQELKEKKREKEILLERMSPEEREPFNTISETKKFFCGLAEEYDRLRKESIKKREHILSGNSTYTAEIIESLFEKSSQDTNGLKSEAEAISNELDEIEKDTIRVSTELDNSDTSEELQDVELELEQLESRKACLLELGDSLKTAIETINEAAEQIQKDYSPALNRKLGEIVSGMTMQRYQDLRADDSMQLKAQAPETGKVVSVANLSGGTGDQMYLALRIAVSDILSENGEKLPLVFDEPFAQYDDNRLCRTLEFLIETAKKRQIVISTCKERERDLGGKICGQDINIISL